MDKMYLPEVGLGRIDRHTGTVLNGGALVRVTLYAQSGEHTYFGNDTFGKAMFTVFRRADDLPVQCLALA